MVRVAIVGARRRRQGLGEYVARFVAEEGGKVVAVVGRTEASAAEAAAHLYEAYGIDAAAFASLAEAADAVPLDAVAICSPHETHLPHLEAAADAGLHVLCEKPLLWGEGLDLGAEAARIAARLGARERLLWTLTQWPYVLEVFDDLFGADRPFPVRTFEMEMAPPGAGPAVVSDAVPHGISLLQALLGDGEADGIAARAGERDGEMVFAFEYAYDAGKAGCTFRYRPTETRPRPAAITIDGLRVDRTVRMPDYTIAFTGGGRTVPVEDPTRRLVRDFLRAIRGEETDRKPVDPVHGATLLGRFREAADQLFEARDRLDFFGGGGGGR